jgi:MFS family permease
VRRASYGWLLVSALSITELVSWGVLIYAFSVFLVPMRAELDWSTAQLTGAYSLGVLVSGLLAIPVGRWLDARGPRALMTAGSLLAVGVLLGWSAVDSPASFYVTYALAGAAMAATLYEPAFATAAVWFGGEQRARAMLVLTVFGGLASVVFVPLTAALVSQLGWRSALVVLAMIVAAVCVPLHATLLRRPDSAVRPPARRPRAAVRSRALRSRAFHWLAVCLVLTTLGRIAVSVHLVAYLAERGYSLKQAAFAAGAIGVLQVAGRLLAGALRGRVPEHIVYSAILVAQGLSVALPLLTHGDGTGASAAVVAFVAIYGLGFGLPELIRAVLVADFWGTEAYAGINGVLGLCVTSARAVAPVAAGATRTIAGSYTPVLLAAGAAAVAGAAALVAAHRSL